MTKVLIVEDSAISRQVLSLILAADPEIEIIGTANNGEEALAFLARNRPDVVTMDIIMPKMDGYEATRRIMETNPLPVVIVSASISQEEVKKTWKAVDAGAVAVLEKPGLGDIGVKGGHAEKLVETVKLMSQVKVVGRRGRRTEPLKSTAAPARAPAPLPAPVPVPIVAKDVRVVVIGASTGGPPALRQILGGLPGDFSVPILIVQHISPGFTVGFVEWLDNTCTIKIRLPGNGETALPGHAYIAPDGLHMAIDRHSRIRLEQDKLNSNIVPSVSWLFRSTAEAFGDKAIGVLLTGMGRDGAQELRLMRDRGAETIAQDEESCIVYGMPGEAMKLDAAKHSLPLERITEMLLGLVNRKRSHRTIV